MCALLNLHYESGVTRKTSLLRVVAGWCDNPRVRADRAGLSCKRRKALTRSPPRARRTQREPRYHANNWRYLRTVATARVSTQVRLGQFND